MNIFLLFEISKICSRVQLWVMIKKAFLATKSRFNRMKQDFLGQTSERDDSFPF